MIAEFGGLGCILALPVFGPRVEPFWLLAAATCLLTAVLLMRRYPAAFLVPLLFVGTLKPQAASGFSILDWTFIATLLLYGAISISVISAFAGVDCVSLRERMRGQQAAIVAVCIFGVIVVASYFHSPAHTYATDKLLRFVVISSAVLLAPLILLRTEKDMRYLAIAMAFFAVVLGCKTFFMSSQEPRTVSGALGHDITRIGPGQLIGMTLLLLLFYRISTGRGYKILVALAVLFLTAALGFSAARGPILSFVIVLGASLLFPRLRSALIFGRAEWIAMVAMLALTFALSMNWLAARSAAERTFVRKTAELAEVLKGTTAPSSTAGKRLAFYKAAAHAIVENPLGLGLGGWSMYYFQGDQRAYPHNLLLEIGAELGFVGLAAFLLLLGLSVARLRLILRRAESLSFLAPVFAYSFLVTMFSGDINDNRFIWMWFGVIFAAVRFARPQQPSRLHIRPEPHTRVRAISVMPNAVSG